MIYFIVPERDRLDLERVDLFLGKRVGTDSLSETQEVLAGKGAALATIQSSEAYTALQAGVIDIYATTDLDFALQFDGQAGYFAFDENLDLISLDPGYRFVPGLDAAVSPDLTVAVVGKRVSDADIQIGDRIEAYNGISISNFESLTAAIASTIADGLDFAVLRVSRSSGSTYETPVLLRGDYVHPSVSGPIAIVGDVTGLESTPHSKAVLGDGSAIFAYLDGTLQRLAADGSVLGEPVPYASTRVEQPEAVPWAPSVAPLADGGFFIIWASYFDSGNLTNPQQSGDIVIRGRLFDADATPRGADFVLNSPTTLIGRSDINLNAAPPDAIFLETGTILASWTSNEPGDRRPMFSEISPTGEVLRTEFSEPELDVVLSSIRELYSFELAPLRSGGFAVLGYVDDLLHYAFSIDDGDIVTLGATISSLIEFPSTNSLMNESGFANAYVTSSLGDLYASFLDAKDGGAVLDLQLHEEFRADYNADIARLADGRWLVAWTTPASIWGNPVMGRLLTAEGDFASNAFELLPASTEFSSPEVLALTNGNVMLFAAQDRGFASTSSISAVFDFSVFNGTAGDDYWRGGSFSDVISGAAGDDWLDAGGAMEGQANFLLGGTGNDTYIVRNPTDIVDEGFAFPDLPGNPSDVDTIISHADFWWDFYGVGEKLIIAEDVSTLPFTGIVGSLFNTEITGNSGNNIIFDLGGANTIRPGDGVDFIALGNIEGFTGVDTIVIEPHVTGAVSWAVIYDFDVGVDRIDLTAFGYDSFMQVQALGFEDGSNGFFALGEDGTDIVYLVGVTMAELGMSDFII